MAISFDVLVKVENFIFSANIVVLDCKDDIEMPIIFSKPFFAMGRALMDMERGGLMFRMNI